MLLGNSQMSATEPPNTGLEAGRRRGSSETTTDSDSDDEESWHSPSNSSAGETNVDLESGELEMKVQLAKEERDCRICHLNLMGGNSNQEIGGFIELGCHCKGDLGAAHKQCAETWFKIKGNTICEICGTTARNVVGEHLNVATHANGSVAAAPAGTVIISEPRSFWPGRRLMNFLLACMVLAFLISWLFHFNIFS